MYQMVLLANIWTDTVNPTGMLMSEKIDGVRAYWDFKRKKLYTRDGNVINTPARFTKGYPDFDLDGELSAGRGKFQTTVSIVKRQQPDDRWERVLYLVFDAPALDGNFAARYKSLVKWNSLTNAPTARVLEQIPCKSRAHLDQFHASICQIGGEGVMLRDPDSYYEHRRSSTLLKVKRVDDDDAIVTGYTKGTGKYATMIGALEVMLPDGTAFKIGSGLRDSDRVHPPKIGSVVSFAYQGKSDKGVPRFPRFLRVRSDTTASQLVKRASVVGSIGKTCPVNKKMVKLHNAEKKHSKTTRCRETRTKKN